MKASRRCRPWELHGSFTTGAPVDDEPHIRAVLRGYLEEEGLAVSEAADGEEAVRQVGQDAPDLVLLDVMLPGIDGIEALWQIRTRSDVVTARGMALGLCRP